ncbi:hypothetical protein N9500_01945 [Candidatus Pelagibacter sp.]|jgi:hypothetical protein|nr:hypothetical protein [Candidatus Pelagibacter sp.]|tara:strand:- start:237 stop:461 length:225 start_codon:yes stop_codon:yes gene_type:complete
MKYFFLSIILFLSSCSLDKNSTYWNKDSVNQSINDKKLSKVINKTTDFKEMTFEEFDLFLQDYSNKSKFPNLDN